MRESIHKERDGSDEKNPGSEHVLFAFPLPSCAPCQQRTWKRCDNEYGIPDDEEKILGSLDFKLSSSLQRGVLMWTNINIRHCVSRIVLL